MAFLSSAAHSSLVTIHVSGCTALFISPGTHHLLTSLNLLLLVVPGFKGNMLLYRSFVLLVKQIQEVDRDNWGVHAL